MSAALLLDSPPPPTSAPFGPIGAALSLWRARDHELLIEGPAGTGKSRAVLEKLHGLCGKYPGIRVLVVRKTRESCTESVLVTFEEKVLPAYSPLKNGPDRARRQRYSYPNGSEIVIGGMDKASKIMSTEYDVIYAAECTELTEDDWESLTTRNRNNVMPYQQMIADCNPSAPTHWLNLRANSGRMTRLLSRHEDNPSVTAAYLDTLRRLTGVRRARYFEGKWAVAEGIVYDNWDASTHLIDRFPIPAEWRRFRVIDFGYTNPFVCQWWAVDPDGRLFRYRELYGTQRLVSDHAGDIARLSAGESYTATVADHDAEDRATLHSLGIHTLPAFKAVTVGIQAVQDRLRPAGDGKPRLFLLRDSLVARDERLVEAKKPLCTEQEIDGYVWAKAADGRPVKEEPVKVDDHGCDAMRYAVAYAEGLGVVKVYSY